MLSLLRKIRQRLLSEKRFSSYLLYAAGEILLVVIGILIALQIDNWNEYEKERMLEQEMLAQLQSEFKSNLQQLNDKMALRRMMIGASEKLLYYKDHPAERNTDSILKQIGITVIAPTFDPIVSDISSTGRIQLLQNHALKERLSRWTSEIIQVTEEEQSWAQYRTDWYQPTLIEYSSFRTIINRYWDNQIVQSFYLDPSTAPKFDLGDSKDLPDLNPLLDESAFEDHVANCASLAKLTNDQSVSLRKRIVEILDIIDSELKTH